MEPTSTEPGAAARNGADSRNFGALPVALLRYLEARGVLLSVETQEAVLHLLRVAMRAAVAAILGFTGWLFLMVSLAWYLTTKYGWSWPEVMVALGGGNLVLATIFAFTASRKVIATRWFEHTLNEFAKDRAWLGQLNDKH